MSGASHRVCLVTDELFPFTVGGIGRLLHNQIRDSIERGGPEIHVLFPAAVDLGSKVADHFGGHQAGGGVLLHDEEALGAVRRAANEVNPGEVRPGQGCEFLFIGVRDDVHGDLPRGLR